MKSIRLSLVVYFLLLQAAALGAASWLAYRTAKQSLDAELTAHQVLLVEQNKDRRHEIEAKFDEELRNQAREIAGLVRYQYQDRRSLTRLMMLGLLSSSEAPQGHLLAPTWAMIGSRSSLQFQIMTILRRDIAVSEDLLHEPNLGGPQYLQINADWGPVWRSRQLGDATLAFDRARFATKKLDDATFDDIILPSGHRGRRVQFKAPIVSFQFLRDANASASGQPARPPGVRPQRPPERDRVLLEAPWVVIHCARATDGVGGLEDALRTIDHDISVSMENRKSAGEAALNKLLATLLIIGAATFALSVMGGYLMVSFGLAPLNRLSEAVGRISPADFRLPLAQKQLPNELEPIADRLRETLEQLRSAFDREKQAVADISHELRTPVTALLATLDVTLRKMRSADEYRRALVEARSVGGHLHHLVERLLALARIDAGHARARFDVVDVSEIAHQVSALVRPLLAEKGLTLTTECSPGLTWTTDGDKLHDVLVNLLHNAIQYNRPDGTIQLSVSVTKAGLEAIVSDTGIGIKAEQLPHLFERFYRADPSREEAALHAGLGLSIVRGYVELIGGTITVDSVFGNGATFRVVLPRAGEPGREREAA